jgi:hypothetical protein
MSVYRLLLIALALIAFLLRIYHLNYQSLWRDEVDAVIFATQDLRAILAMFTGVGDNGPLYFLGLHYWIALAGKSEFAIRFPSAFFGVLAVLATYHLGREVIGRDVGLIGALLLAVSPYHVWYSQEAKMYSIISFLAPLSLLIIVRVLRGGKRRLWPAWALLLGIFLYIHLFALMMVLVAALWLPLLLQRRPRLTPALVAAIVLVALAILPVARWLIPAALMQVQTGYYPYALGEMVSILLYGFSMGLRPVPGPWPVIVFVGLLLTGLAALVVRSRGARWPDSRGVLVLALYLVAPLLAIWLVSLRRPTFTDRYLIIVLPAFYLLIAGGIVVIREIVGLATGPRPAPAHEAAPARNRRIAATRAGPAYSGQESVPQEEPRRRFAGEVAAALMLALALVVSLRFVWTQSHSEIKADFRAATAYLVPQLLPQDVVIFIMPYVQRGFAYYHPQPVRTVDPPYTRGMSQADVDRAMDSLRGGSRRVWLFLSEETSWDPDGLITAYFERTARRCPQEQAMFAYIEVRCYELTVP